MHPPAHQEISRIYEGFDDAHRSEPQRFESVEVKEWSGNRTDRRDGNGVRLDFDDEVAKGHWELFRPNRGMLVCLTDGLYHETFTQKILPRADTITIRFVLSGTLSVTFAETGTLEIPQACSSIMFTPRARDFDLSIEGGSHLSAVTFHLHPKSLYEDFEIILDKFPEHLQDIIYGRERSKSLYNFPISPGMMNNVMDLLKMPYEGARRRLFTEAKSCELICRLFQEIEDDFEALPVLASPAHSIRAKVFDAQRLLVEHYKLPLTLAELARQVGLNRTTLCTEFKSVFGMTVFEFCRGYRMNKARELLQDRNLSISQVSGEVGYTYPANFTAAFKNHFGVLPKAVRST